MTYDNRAVGVFDSGLGGLTSVREIEKLLPNEDIVYFGDTGRVPYGTRSAQAVLKYSRDDLRFLLTHNIKAVLIACGTVSSIALDELAKDSPVPIIGVVKPASKLAAQLSKEPCGGACGSIAVLGTPATVKNGAYEREIKSIMPDARVFPVGCPMFVPLVENGYIGDDNPVTALVAREYAERLLPAKPSCVILGCTHYPLIRKTIENALSDVLGYLPRVVDAGASAAKELSALIADKGISAQLGRKGQSGFYVSDETQNFSKTASVFLGRKIEAVTRIDIEKY